MCRINDIHLTLVPLTLEVRKSKRGRELVQTVLHLQSPTIRTTYIRCPMTTSDANVVSPELGITLPWLHIQVRPLGNGNGSGRDVWAFDLGVADRSGKRGVIRASTFQVRSDTFKLCGGQRTNPDRNMSSTCRCGVRNIFHTFPTLCCVFC